MPSISERSSCLLREELEDDNDFRETTVIVEYDERLDCILGRAKGQLDYAAVEMFVGHVVSQARIHDCQCVLSDLRNAELELSQSDISDIPALMGRMGFRRPWRGALVVSDDAEEFQFLEPVAQARGFMLKVFDDFERAVAWISCQGQP